jgi:hypothetical protein
MALDATTPTSTSHHMTRAELDALPVSISVVTAGRALGLSRTSAYLQANNGTFPVRVFRSGTRLLVATAELRRLLGVEDAA